MRAKAWVTVAAAVAACLALAAGPALAEQYNPNKKKNQGSATSQQMNKGQQGMRMGGQQGSMTGQQNKMGQQGSRMSGGQQSGQMGQQNKMGQQGSQQNKMGQQGGQTGQQNKNIPQGGPGTSPLVTYGSGGN
jgi:hypothetical protein